MQTIAVFTLTLESGGRSDGVSSRSFLLPPPPSSSDTMRHLILLIISKMVFANTARWRVFSLCVLALWLGKVIHGKHRAARPWALLNSTPALMFFGAGKKYCAKRNYIFRHML